MSPRFVQVMTSLRDSLIAYRVRSRRGWQGAPRRISPGRSGYGRSALLVGVSVPYAEAVPDGGLIRLRRPRPSAPPSSSGLGHRPFKAAARVRIPLGARVGYGWRYEVL